MPEVPRRDNKYTPRKIGQSRSLSSVALAKGEGFSTLPGIFKCGVYIPLALENTRFLDKA